MGKVVMPLIVLGLIGAVAVGCSSKGSAPPSESPAVRSGSLDEDTCAAFRQVADDGLCEAAEAAGYSAADREWCENVDRNCGG